jgi:hypothetical protein
MHTTQTMHTTHAMTSARPSTLLALEQNIPAVLRPVLRAYVLGYASSTGPRLLTLFLTHLSRRRKNIVDEKPEASLYRSLLRILKGGLEVQRFPTFCAAIVGGSTLLQARDHLPFLRRTVHLRILTCSRSLCEESLLVWRQRCRELLN